MVFKRIFSSLLLVCLLLTSAMVVAVAAEPAGKVAQAVMIVLDASGSMRGKTQGQTKMDVAKKVVRDLLKNWDSSMDVGLTVYGHRRKGDCRDIEVMIPVQKINKSQIKDTLSSIQPKGMTPLSDAVLKAAKALKYQEQKATVILISDGKETCERDPCQLGKMLKANGLDFKAYVVGFSVNKKEQTGLRCLAKNTGGKFFEANNARQLKSVLTKVVSTVRREAPKKVLGKNLKLSAALVPGGQAISTGLVWGIYLPEKDIDGKRQRVTYSYKPSPTFDLKPGRYFVTVRHGSASASQDIVIQANQLTRATLVLNAGYLRMKAVPNEEGPILKSHLVWNVYTTKKDFEGNRQRVTYSYSTGPKFILHAGKYVVRVAYGSAVRQEGVSIEAGKYLEKTINMKAGLLVPKAVTDEGGATLKSNVTWSVFAEKVDFNGNRKRITYSYSPQPTFRLPAGKFILQVKFGNAVKRTPITIKPAARQVMDVALNVGIVKLSCVTATNLAISKVSWVIQRPVTGAEGEYKRVTYSYSSKPTFRLAAGTYRVVVTYREKKYYQTLVVKPGDYLNQVIKIKDA